MNVYPVIDTEEPQKETLAMLAHDLRTPMCSVVGAAQLAMRAQAQGKPVDEQLRQIVGAVQAMDRMLKRMCSGSCGGTVSALESELRTMITPRAAVKHQRLIIDLAGIDGCTLPADFGSLCRVLSNLLVNAVKFTPEGGEVSLTAAVEKTGRQDFAVFSVCDSGMGMKPGFQKEMYRQHTRARESAHIPGHGLGLTIVQRLVGEMGGVIAAESRWGGGTTFTVRIPLAGALQ